MRDCILLITRLSVLSTVGFLAGCIPAPMGKYYKPIYLDPSAKYQGDECQGKAGAPASLAWSIADGVTISVTTVRRFGEKNRPDRPLRISIEVPSGTRFQFLSDEIRVSNSLQERGESVPSDIFISASVLMASHEIVDLAKIAPTPFPANGSDLQIKDFSAATWLNFSWKDNFVPKAFTMEIPPVLLPDSPRTAALPISLEATAKRRPERYAGQNKTSTSLIYATKESESALAEKYIRCRSEKPDANCENILVYDDIGFNLERDGFKFSGRWYVHDVEKKTPFNGEIKISYSTPARWQFATNRIRVIDTDNKAERSYQFDNYPLHFSYQVPINTPIRGLTNVTHTNPIKASIDSSLGTDDLPSYFVKMPPVLINGRQYQIRPIEFERRLFDFGLEPFNC